jgi:hypothetical protein
VALRWADPLSYESYRLCIQSINLKSGQGPTMGFRAFDDDDDDDDDDKFTFATILPV